MEDISERVKIIKVLYFTQVIEEVLGVMLKEDKVKFIGERVGLLILNPLSLHSSSIAPVVLYIGLILLKF